jgi:DNA invertase Pin-like site-specific DNA recombinase
MNTELKKVAIYARVSSERQDTDLSISAQLKALREYALRNGYTVVKEYVDEAESGRSIDRPGFRQMIAAARQKNPPFQAILVWKLSRFARNREDSIIYKSLLRKQGIQVVSINEPVDDTPSGKLLEGIIEVIDEFYSANLSQDVLRGMKENAGRGFRNGGRAPYGYIRVKVQDGTKSRTKLEPDPKTAPIVQRVFRECLEGKGLKAIARGLNTDGLASSTGKKWGATSIEKILHNEAYTGALVWGKRSRTHNPTKNSLPSLRMESAWPVVVDETTFTQAQAILIARAPMVTHPREIDSPYLLSGIMRCGRCGAAMVGHRGGCRYRYYMCGNARRKGREVCPSPILRKDRVEGFVIDRIKGYILTEENLEELVKLTNEELVQTCAEEKEKLKLLEAEIAEVDGRLGKLYDALETGEFKGGLLAPRIQALFQKKEELQQAKAEAEEVLRYKAVDIADPQVVREYVDDLRDLLDRSSIVEQRSFLKSFVEKIEVGDSEVRVYYTIPMPPNSLPEETVGVIPFTHLGQRRGGRYIKKRG